MHRTCDLELSSFLCQAFSFIVFFLSQNWKPTSSLLPTGLFLSSHSANPSPVMHAFVVCACVRACVRACVCVCARLVLLTAIAIVCILCCWVWRREQLLTSEVTLKPELGHIVLLGKQFGAHEDRSHPCQYDYFSFIDNYPDCSWSTSCVCVCVCVCVCFQA